MKVENTKRLLHNGETVKADDEVWVEHGFERAQHVGMVGKTVQENDFVLRPAKNELGS